MSAPAITFLSDYGLHDDFVGVAFGREQRRSKRGEHTSVTSPHQQAFLEAGTTQEAADAMGVGVGFETLPG